VAPAKPYSQDQGNKAIVLRVPVAPDKPWQINQDEIVILKNAICKGATDEELKFCLAVARRHKLDPFRGQIWFVKRKDSTAVGGHRWIPIVGIGGMLHIAARDHKDFGSNDEPEYGPMHEVKWSYYDKSGKFQAPEWAKVSVWKKGLEHPTVATVWWDEIYPDVGAAPLVRQMPRLMLGKCALAQAVRRAYPATDGLYIKEEFVEREQFTPEGREIVYNEPAQLEEAKVDPNWQKFLDRLTPEEREKEIAAVAKNTPAQREILAEKMKKADKPIMDVEYVDPAPSRCAECGSSFGVHLIKCSKFKTPQVDRSKPAEGQGAAVLEGAAVPCLFWKAHSESGTYEIIATTKEAQDLANQHKDLFAPLWDGNARKLVCMKRGDVSAEKQLGTLISQLEKRKVPFREIQ
jgi:hypothetical protein